MTTSPPLVSVVIPTYNRLGLLRQAIQSVAAQEYTNYETIVADDGSTDGTADYVTSLSSPPVRYLRLEHTGIVAATRNAGAGSATGAYLAFLDSDDLWHPTKLSVQLAQMRGAGVSWSYTCYDMIDLDGRGMPLRSGTWTPLSGHIAKAVLTTEASIAISTLLVTSDLFNRVGRFDEDRRINFREDHELVVRLALASPAWAVQDSLTRIREHDGRSTHGLGAALSSVTSAHVYTKVLSFLEERELVTVARRRRAYHLAEAGSQYLSTRAIGPAVSCFLRSIRDGVEAKHLASAVGRGLGRIMPDRSGV